MYENSEEFIGFEGMFYNRNEIDKERYLLFVENFYGDQISTYRYFK